MSTETPMLNLIRLFVLAATVAAALAQLNPPHPEMDGRIYRLEAAAAANAEHIAAIEKLDLDRRMTKIEVRLESIDGWAKLIGTSSIGALLTWAVGQFMRLVRSQREAKE